MDDKVDSKPEGKADGNAGLPAFAKEMGNA
jgi:hypothetical protein